MAWFPTQAELKAMLERQARLKAGLPVYGYGGALSGEELFQAMSKKVAEVASKDVLPTSYQGDYWTSPSGVVYYWNSIRKEYAIHTTTEALRAQITEMVQPSVVKPILPEAKAHLAELEAMRVLALPKEEKMATVGLAVLPKLEPVSTKEVAVTTVAKPLEVSAVAKPTIAKKELEAEGEGVSVSVGLGLSLLVLGVLFVIVWLGLRRG